MLLLVDQRMSMFFGSRRAMKSVAAAEAAALAAFRVTSLGDRVGAIVFSEQGVVEIRPEARDAAVRHILAEVVRQNRRRRRTARQPTHRCSTRRSTARRASPTTTGWSA